MRGAQLRRLAAITSAMARHANEPPPPPGWRDRTRVYVNRAERRARVDDLELVPPELDRRPSLSDGEPGE